MDGKCCCFRELVLKQEQRVREMIKRAIVVLSVFILIFTGSVPPAGAIGDPYEYCNSIKLQVGSKTAYINGKPRLMNTQSAPYIASGRVVIPLRFVAEALDASVTWDGFLKGRTDVETGDGIIVEFLAGDKTIYIGDLNHRKDTHANPGWVRRVMDLAPVMKKDDYMYVPVRSFADAIGASLSYDAKTKTVTLKRVDSKKWKEYTEPNTGTKIKFPNDWKINQKDSVLDIYSNGTNVIFSYETGTPQEILHRHKEQLLEKDWKVYETETFLKMSGEYQGNEIVRIVSLRKLAEGCLVFVVKSQAGASDWNMMIVDKITPGPGI